MQIKFQKAGSPSVAFINAPDSVNAFTAVQVATAELMMTESGVSLVSNVTIYDYTFENMSSSATRFKFKNVSFVNCKFINCNFDFSEFEGCSCENCEFYSTFGRILDVLNNKVSPKEATKLRTNDEIEKAFKCKCKSLQNKKYVKCIFTCDFCHKETVAIFHRNSVESPFLDVPNCDRKVCRDCYSNYNLTDKFYGHRHYGYAGPVSRYTTPIDKPNTVILGLEMEFEGDFYGWKELQDAHNGYLHYGYDSSVDGQNELSWDCGSYSWWKYVAPLKEVCDALKKYGGRAGDTAGIHVHASIMDLSMRELAHKININCRSGKWNALMKAVSMRNDLEKFNRYANLGLPETTHHAGISYNSHGTVEFRIFNSSVDHNEILHMLKFVKETFMFFANGREKVIYSPESKSFITRCADAQLKKGFITEKEYNRIKKEFI